MLIAPHPDDEALACSVILQKAVRAGAAIRIIYVTDGDDNPWPQRAVERRWRLSASDRERWGKLRRSEALAALGVLDIHPADVQFLALPDQGLTDLLLRDCNRALTRLIQVIDDWRSEEHTSELQSRFDLVCRLLLEKKNLYSNFLFKI